MADREQGNVKWWNNAKAFGKIESDFGGALVFVHISQVEGGEKLAQDERVEYEITTNPRGLAATKVRRIS
jgi:CspA family cold shock protein